MSNTLIISFGNSDAMFVYRLSQNRDEYHQAKIGEKLDLLLNNYSKLPLFSHEQISDEIKFGDRNRFNERTPVGFIFPKLSKTLFYLLDDDIQIEKLVIVTTDRKNCVDVIINIRNICKNNEYKKALKYANNLIGFIKKDDSNIYAQTLDKVINSHKSFIHTKQGRFLLDNRKHDQMNTIKNISILKLTIEPEIIDDIQKIDFNKLSEKEIIKILEKFEINKHSFFLKELYYQFNNIKTRICQDKIFLSLQGGMCAMQDSILEIIDLLFPDNLERILEIPENMNIIPKDNRYHIYRLLRLRNEIKLLQTQNITKKIEEKKNEVISIIDQYGIGEKNINFEENMDERLFQAISKMNKE